MRLEERREPASRARDCAVPARTLAPRLLFPRLMPVRRECESQCPAVASAMQRPARVGVAVSVGKERRERMDAFETLTAAMLAPAPPALGLPPESALAFVQLSTTLA